MHVNAAKAYEAAGVLDLDVEGLTTDAITKAYRSASKGCHPDSGSHDAVRWARISWAKELLLKWLELRLKAREPLGGAKGSCRACGGSGRIQRRQGFGLGVPMQCVMCRGTGNVKQHDRDE